MKLDGRASSHGKSKEAHLVTSTHIQTYTYTHTYTYTRYMTCIGAFAGDHYVFTLADGYRIAQIYVEATQLLNSVARQLQHQVLLCLFTV